MSWPYTGHMDHCKGNCDGYCAEEAQNLLAKEVEGLKKFKEAINDINNAMKHGDAVTMPYGGSWHNRIQTLLENK